MHHRTKRIIQLATKNALICIGLIASLFAYAIILNTTEIFWLQVVLATSPFIAAVSFMVWTVTKSQIESEERAQERTLLELSKEWKNPDYYSDAVQTPIAKVFKDDI